MLAPTQTVSDLQRARNLIADPAKWETGTSLGMAPKEPTRFCAALADLHVRGVERFYSNVSPALVRAAVEMGKKLRCDQIPLTADDFPPAFVWAVNDHLGHTATLAMFDRAIQLAVQEGVGG